MNHAPVESRISTRNARTAAADHEDQSDDAHLSAYNAAFSELGLRFRWDRATFDMLVLTVMMMGLSTAAIGLLPAFSTIGWLAPVLLVTLRAIQGFAVGGEWGGAALMAVESAPEKKKAFYSSGVQVGYGVGLVLSTGLVALISRSMDNAAFLSWGWRLPFLFSVVLVLIALWIRSSMSSSGRTRKA